MKDRTPEGLEQVVELAVRAVLADGSITSRRPEVAGCLEDCVRYAARIPDGVAAVVDNNLREAHRLFLHHSHGAVDEVTQCLRSALEHLGVGAT